MNHVTSSKFPVPKSVKLSISVRFREISVRIDNSSRPGTPTIWANRLRQRIATRERSGGGLGEGKVETRIEY